MENVSTGVLGKNKERCLRYKHKADKSYVKIQKYKDLQSIMSNLQPNCCLKVDI